MNKLQGTIRDIQNAGEILLLEISVGGDTFSAVVIRDTSKFTVGQSVEILFKETEVILGVDLNLNISLRNRFTCVIKNIDRGQILSVVSLKYLDKEIQSIITTKSVDSLNLSVGKDIVAFVKTNELMLAQ